MNSELSERQKKICEEFSLFDDNDDKYRLIIEKGEALEPLSQEEKSDQNMVKGCTSRTWVVVDPDSSGNFRFRGDSESVLVKGLVAMLVEAWSGLPAQEIAGAQPGFVECTGLGKLLSPNRVNGFASMISRIKEEAAKRL